MQKFNCKPHLERPKATQALQRRYQEMVGSRLNSSVSLLLSAASAFSLAFKVSGQRCGTHTQVRNRRRNSPDTRRPLPRCVVFDLDGCLWSPEMYELSWDRGGAPFAYDTQGVMRDKRGCVISLHSGVESALTELATDKKWKGVTVAVASCCDVPPWAFELLGKFEFGPSKSKLNELITICKIHKGGKQGHLREIQQVVGCSFDEIIFFDNEPYNCQQVASLSATLRTSPPWLWGIGGQTQLVFHKCYFPNKALMVCICSQSS